MRKVALGFLSLAALVAPVLTTAGFAAPKKPVKLDLIRVEAIETEDGGINGGQADELVVEVGGTIVFGPQDILNGQSLGLTAVPDTRFRRNVTVRLIDQDVVGADDAVGETKIGRGLAGDGVQNRVLQANGGIYELVFKVVK